MKILFVCRYNRFRSQIAEQFFKRYNKNKKLFVKSTGIFKGRYPLDNQEVETAKQFGININKKPETISVDDLSKTDLIVIVADDIPKNLFTYEGEYIQKVIKWKVSDEFTGDKKKIERVIKSIEIKVKGLVKKLEVGK